MGRHYSLGVTILPWMEDPFQLLFCHWRTDEQSPLNRAEPTTTPVQTLRLAGTTPKDYYRLLHYTHKTEDKTCVLGGEPGDW